MEDSLSLTLAATLYKEACFLKLGLSPPLLPLSLSHSHSLHIYYKKWLNRGPAGEPNPLEAAMNRAKFDHARDGEGTREVKLIPKQHIAIPTCDFYISKLNLILIIFY